jgi:cytochrome bd-type quinol oxidase subunit 2
LIVPGAGDRAEPVSWEEAREVLIVVLLIVALGYLTGPLVRQFAVDNRYDFWEDMRVVLGNIDVVSGMLLVGAALAVCTAPADATVPALSRAASLVAKTFTVLGIVAMINVLTARNAADSFFLRISLLMVASGPGTLLAGLAAWLVDRVDTARPESG